MEHTIAAPAVLIIEDEPTILDILARLLRGRVGNYELLTFGNADAALRQLQHRPVVLIITDYNMPGMNGLELTSAVKAVSPGTRVIMITAYTTPTLERAAYARGVDHYLPKPFPLDHFEGIVRMALTAVPDRN